MERVEANVRARDVKVTVRIVSDDTVVQDEGALVRAHLLSGKVALSRDVEDRQLSVFAITNGRAPENELKWLTPLVRKRQRKNVAYVVFSSVGCKSSTVAILTQLHDSLGVGMAESSNFWGGKFFGQSAGRCWPRSVISSMFVRRSSCEQTRGSEISQERNGDGRTYRVGELLEGLDDRRIFDRLGPFVFVSVDQVVHAGIEIGADSEFVFQNDLAEFLRMGTM